MCVHVYAGFSSKVTNVLGEVMSSVTYSVIEGKSGEGEGGGVVRG